MRSEVASLIPKTGERRDLSFEMRAFQGHHENRQDKAIAAIEKLGGTVTVDEKKPGKPVKSVALHAFQVTDAGLEHLKWLTQLQSLDLWGTKVSDAGLVRLKGLTELQWLDLWETQVTDAGVKDLQRALPHCKVDRYSID